ncbi:MAG: fasciclin domain-containing protein [Bacteroidales bacterium]|nr:fasciclin domain-containing protein [Bacteroidales bacterium]
MKKNIFTLLILVGICLCMTSCELFGLSYAYSFKNEPGKDFDTLNCNAYEFIESRADNDLTLMYEAINRAGLKDLFEAEDYTYFILKNDQWDDYMSTAKYSCIQDIPVSELRTYILGYIVHGKYTSKDVTNPIYLESMNGVQIMRMYKTQTAPTSSQNLNSLVAGWVNPDGGVYQRGCITSNLVCTNGVVHILSSRLIIVV